MGFHAIAPLPCVLVVLLSCATVAAQCEEVFPPATGELLVGTGSGSMVTVIVVDDALSDALCEAGDEARELPVALLSVKHNGLMIGGDVDDAGAAVALSDGVFVASCESQDVAEFIRWAHEVADGVPPPPVIDDLDCAGPAADLDWDFATRWGAMQWALADDHVECLAATGRADEAAVLVQRAWRSSAAGSPGMYGVRGAFGARMWRTVAAAGREGATSEVVTRVLEEQLEDVALQVFAAENVSARAFLDIGDLTLFAVLLGREALLAEFVRESPVAAQLAGQVGVVDRVFDALADTGRFEAEAARIAGDLVPFCRQRLDTVMREGRQAGEHPSARVPVLRRMLPGMIAVAAQVEGAAGAVSVVRAAAQLGPYPGVEALRAARDAGLDDKALRAAANGVLKRCSEELDPHQVTFIRSVGSP